MTWGRGNQRMAEMTAGDTFYFSLLFQSFISGPLFWPFILALYFRPFISASYFIHRPRKRRSRKMVPRKQSSMHMAVQTPWRPREGAKAAASVRRTAQMLNTFMIHGTTVLAGRRIRHRQRWRRQTWVRQRLLCVRRRCLTDGFLQLDS